MGFYDFLGGHKLRRLSPKQGTYFHLLSSAFEGSPLLRGDIVYGWPLSNII
jgi:hypothetical protein